MSPLVNAMINVYILVGVVIIALALVAIAVKKN